MKIRNYSTVKDYDLIQSWWQSIGDRVPTPEMLPEESSFILEYMEEPYLFVTVYLMKDVKCFALVEHLIKDPKKNLKNGHDLVMFMQEHLLTFGRENGVKELHCAMDSIKLIQRYEQMGWRKQNNYFKFLTLEV